MDDARFSALLTHGQDNAYSNEPTRVEVRRRSGVVILEFLTERPFRTPGRTAFKLTLKEAVQIGESLKESAFY